MNKKLTSLLFFTIGLLQAQAQDLDFEGRITLHDQLFNAVAPNINRIAHRLHYHDRDGNPVYDYTGPADVINVWDRYRDAKSNLNSKIQGRALGDGFILGTVLALLNRLAFGNKVNKWVAGIGICGSSIAFKYFQNKSFAASPYFNDRRVRHDNLFEPASLETFGQSVLAMTGATISFMGTTYALERFVQWKNQNKKQKENEEAKSVQPENQSEQKLESAK